MTASTSSPSPFVIGVTGNIACGKTTVMNELRRLGAATIDADQVYHRLIEPGTPLGQALIDHFGTDIRGDDGAIDRRALGRIVFADPSKLAELEALTHSVIRDEVRSLIAEHASGVVAIDAVKLFEGGMSDDCDSVWLVTCRPDQQVERLIARNGLSAEDARRRIAAQPPIEPKLALADVHIDNSGNKAATLAQVYRAWNELGLEGYVREAGSAGAGGRRDRARSH